MVHMVNGVEYKTKISTLRGDYRKPDGSTGNRLRPWEISDFRPRPDDIFGERLYAIQWMRPKKGRGEEYEFRSVTEATSSASASSSGTSPRISRSGRSGAGSPTCGSSPAYKTDEPIRERGWTYWHHLFNPRQLLLAALVNRRVATRGSSSGSPSC